MAQKIETVIKDIVAIQSDDVRRIAFKTMEHNGTTSLMISVSDAGEGASFFFEDAHEVKTFAKRLLEAADMMVD